MTSVILGLVPLLVVVVGLWEVVSTGVTIGLRVVLVVTGLCVVVSGSLGVLSVGIVRVGLVTGILVVVDIRLVVVVDGL